MLEVGYFAFGLALRWRGRLPKWRRTHDAPTLHGVVGVGVLPLVLYIDGAEKMKSYRYEGDYATRYAIVDTSQSMRFTVKFHAPRKRTPAFGAVIST